MAALISCIGTTHDLRRPKLELYSESTIGLQSNLKLYGYEAKEKTPMAV